MPNTSAAKKAHRQSITRRAHNRTQRTALRTVLKKFRTAAAGEDRDAAQAAYRLVVKRLDQAASKGLLHKKAAARTKSRLSKLLVAKPAAPKAE